MSEPFVPRIGGVLSADMAVPEHERTVHFYSRVLTTGERPLWREDLLNNLGIPIIGLGAQSTEYARLPLQWMPHIQVADVAASVQRALALGGQELTHGKDDDGNGQWAVQNVGMQDGDEPYDDYSMLGEDGEPAAGICHARGVNMGVPQAWMIYLPVGDLAESLRRVEEEAGTIIKAAPGRSGEYAYAAVQDPVGACLALMPV